VGDAGWCGHAAGVNNALLNLRQRCRLGDGAGGPGEGDGVDPAEFDRDPSPCHAGAPLSDSDQQQGEPAQQDVGVDAWFDAVIDGSRVEGGFHVTEPAFGFEEVLIAERDVLGGQIRIRRRQQILAVESFLGTHLGEIDP
jgi:hypothetical protein